MQSLPAYIPGASLVDPAQGLAICRCRRGYSYSFSVQSDSRLASSPQFNLDANGLGVVLRVQPQVSFKSDDCEESDEGSVRGTANSNYVAGPMQLQSYTPRGYYLSIDVPDAQADYIQGSTFYFTCNAMPSFPLPCDWLVPGLVLSVLSTSASTPLGYAMVESTFDLNPGVLSPALRVALLAPLSGYAPNGTVIPNAVYYPGLVSIGQGGALVSNAGIVGNTPNLPPPYYLVDFGTMTPPFDADVRVVGGVAVANALPFYVAHQRRKAIPAERREHRLSYMPPGLVTVPIPPGATGIFGASPGVQATLNFGSGPTAPGYALSLPDSVKPWPLGFATSVTCGAPFGFVIEF